MAWVRSNALTLVAFGALCALLATQLAQMITTDGWLALVSGRLIVKHGLPSHDNLTVLADGRDWVDQQWLGQVLLYGIHRGGGIWLLDVVEVVLVLGALMGAIVFARRRGATEPVVGVISLAAALPLAATASSVRPQSFCYPLWVLIIVLVSRKGRLTPWVVLAALAILVVWANLHGSVLLAAGLVSWRGIKELVLHRRSLLGWVTLFGPGVALFATPYAPGLLHYYSRTAFNPTFGRYLVQWAPTAATPTAIPIFILILTGVWLYGRRPSTLDGFEWIAVAVSSLAALSAVRNWPWLCLTAVALAPRGVGARTLRRRSIRDGLALLGLLLAMSLPLSFLGLSTRQARLYPAVAADRVAAAAKADPHRTVWASTRVGDWLLWQRPDLRGALLADARYELLTDRELERVVLFRYGAALQWTEARAQVFVIDPDTDYRALDAIRARVRIVYTSAHIVVAVARPSRGK